MKKVSIAIGIALAVGLVAVVLVLALVIRPAFQQKVYATTPAAVAFINTDRILKGQWQRLGLDGAAVARVEAKAAGAMLQGGSRFYAVADYAPESFAAVETELAMHPSRPFTLRDRTLGIDLSGVRYDIETSPTDGPDCYALIVPGETNRIHYCAYAGDG